MSKKFQDTEEGKKQETLFDNMDNFDWWKKEWKDMPEFIMKDLSSEHSVIVHFESTKDRDEFAELVGQNIYSTTKSIWYPKVKVERFMNKRYIDEKKLSECCGSEMLPYETPICSSCKDHCDTEEE
tara:strand:- start:952 stop:1329 length:378 start_codon:yes stop_codon:yes gene_type:complete